MKQGGRQDFVHENVSQLGLDPQALPWESPHPEAGGPWAQKGCGLGTMQVHES